MIITQEKSTPVLSNIIAAPSRFKIKASAKAFKILSGFYSEPILAIPRELGANAWDSHVKANNTDKMFEVHAPNTLEPWFAIRDFGTGLSSNAIDTIYTTYFESTKTADNDSDGCMGLGSKTPFNYTDNFNVTSWHNGKKHVYNCFIDESGSPSIMHVVTQDSTEHTGVEIKFGVKISDIGMWVDKIARAYEPFRYRPVIVGAKIEYQPREYIYTGKRWSMRKSDGGYYNRGCNAFMGNYCYPINTSALRNALYNVPNNDAYKLEQALNGGNFDFFFDIGELEVAPNKEQLQYEDTNATTLAIIAAVQTAITELAEIVTKNIETPKSRWEAMQLYNKYNGYGSQYSHIRNIIGDIPIKYNGLTVTHGSENINAVHKATGAFDPTTNLVSAFDPTTNLVSGFTVYMLDSVTGRFKRTSNYSTYSENRGVDIFYTNLSAIKSARLRYHLGTKYATGVFPHCYIITDESKNNDTFNKHMNYFGWNKNIVTNIESLPKPPPTPRQKKTAGTDEIFYADISEFIKPTKKHHNGAYVYWGKKAATFDSTGTYYYIDFYYSDPVWNNGVNVDTYMSDAVKIFVDNKLNGSETTIYGINVKNKNLLKIGKWINIFDLVKNAVLSNKDKHEQDLFRVQLRATFDSLSAIYTTLTRHPQIITNITNTDTRKKFQEFVKVYAGLSNNASTDVKFLELFGIKPKKHSELSIDPSEFKKMLNEKYLGVLGIGDSYSTVSAPIYKIINFIDEKS
jgi:hypothetical protein